MIAEEFRAIKGYEGLYEVSNYGRVRSLRDKNGHRREIIRTINRHKSGYTYIHLHKNGKSKHYLIHRLVAMAFIPNPDGLPEVNHIDEDKTNNYVWNLEWVTSKQNTNHGTAIQRRVEKQSKPVYQYTKSGEFVRSYPSTCEAARQTGIDQGGISRCCLGIYHFAGNYIWRYTLPKGQLF